MSYEDIERQLEHRGIKPTPNRVLVYRELRDAQNPVSLNDLEIALAPTDKASIFRVLELYTQKDIVHTIEDGSRSLKYELCHGYGEHSATDQHPHFYCEECGRVFCFDNIAIPQLSLPDGFEVKSINFMFKGKCPKCKSR